MTESQDEEEGETGSQLLQAPASEPIDLTDEQSHAVSQVVDWYMTDDTHQVFKLHGYAGTGKTTVLKEVVDRLRGLEPEIRVHFAAPTGKAARVMRAKGLAGATTLHSSGLIWRYRRSKRTGRTYPHPLPKGEAGLDEVDLLVVDEASMVGDELAARITKHPHKGDLFDWAKGERREHLKVLAVGDPAQLWPIPPRGEDAKPSPWAEEGKHHARLETIHRSAEHSLILEAANAVRGPEVRDHGRMWSLVGMGTEPDMKRFLSADQVIAYQNETRWHMVNLLRRANGMPTGEPVKGDRLVLLRNCDFGVNGEQYEVQWATRATMPGCDEFDEFDYFTVGFTDGRSANVAACAFEGVSGEAKAGRLASKADVLPMTFADAITCHKAQGSEWDSVVVVDEGFLSSNAQGWHYTAITRARESVSVVSSRHLPSGWSLDEARAIRDEWWTIVNQLQGPSSPLTGPVRQTALALIEASDDCDSLRVVGDLERVAEQVNRSVSTVKAHMTKLRKAGYLTGKGPLTMISFPWGVESPGLVAQLHARMARHALADGDAA